MVKPFVHIKLPSRIDTISGYVEIIEEKVVDIEGKKLLYYLGCGMVDNSCCGVGGCGYVLAIGFLRKYKALKNKEGLFVSEIEVIEENAKKIEVETLLKKMEIVPQVVFWEF